MNKLNRSLLQLAICVPTVYCVGYFATHFAVSYAIVNFSAFNAVMCAIFCVFLSGLFGFYFFQLYSYIEKKYFS